MSEFTRTRRLRTSRVLRDLTAETRLTRECLMMPYFVQEGLKEPFDIPSMPGIRRDNVESLVEAVGRDMDLGVRSILLFGLPEKKDYEGSSAWEGETIVGRAVKALKQRFGADLMIAADVCLCAYTDHGHCGLLQECGAIKNDETIERLGRMCASLARDGIDMVAPSDMMDGRVLAIRDALDEDGFVDLPIMSYSAKYSSAYYGPFREAADSAPSFGDRKSYQMDLRNGVEAEREVIADIEEGADIVMVKPALAYLDIIRRVKETVDTPIACYNVSGEFSMVKAAASKGWIDGDAVALENLIAMRRAGSDILITYHAREMLEKGLI